MIKHIKQFIALPILAILLSGCPVPTPNPNGGGLGHGALSYRAGFVLDTNNNLHLVYSNTHAEQMWHLEKRSGEGWKRELIHSPSSGLDRAQIEGGTLCAYIGEYREDTDSRLYYRACREENGGWMLNGINPPTPVLAAGRLYLEGGKEAIDYGELFPYPIHSLEELKSINFSRVNLEMGTREEYLPPLDLTLFSPYKEEGLQYRYHDGSMVPFYNEGKWDGTAFTYCVPLEHPDRATDIIEKAVCYALSYKEGLWLVEKIAEYPYGQYAEGTNGRDYYFFGITVGSIFWKDQLVTTLGREVVVKKNPVSGKIETEPIPPSYRAIFKKYEDLPYFAASIDDMKASCCSPVDLVDADGKVHLLVIEGTDFNVDLYHEVYNPDAPDPTIPELREFIEHQE